MWDDKQNHQTRRENNKKVLSGGKLTAWLKTMKAKHFLRILTFQRDGARVNLNNQHWKIDVFPTGRNAKPRDFTISIIQKLKQTQQVVVFQLQLAHPKPERSSPITLAPAKQNIKRYETAIPWLTPSGPFCRPKPGRPPETADSQFPPEPASPPPTSPEVFTQYSKTFQQDIRNALAIPKTVVWFK
jgi:hypothetical protein